eukprot:5025726-Alexandrium_andersonii.AAC.2
MMGMRLTFWDTYVTRSLPITLPCAPRACEASVVAIVAALAIALPLAAAVRGLEAAAVAAPAAPRPLCPLGAAAARPSWRLLPPAEEEDTRSDRERALSSRARLSAAN